MPAIFSWVLRVSRRSLLVKVGNFFRVVSIFCTSVSRCLRRVLNSLLLRGGIISVRSQAVIARKEGGRFISFYLLEKWLE